MRERRRNFPERKLMLRIWTLKDKSSPMFRARNPDTHFVEIWSGNMQIRDFAFAEASKATAHFNHLVLAFERPYAPYPEPPSIPKKLDDPFTIFRLYNGGQTEVGRVTQKMRDALAKTKRGVNGYHFKVGRTHYFTRRRSAKT